MIYSKYVDTVNHDIILKKLSAVGANESAVSWLDSYLSNRGEFVELSGVKSSTQDIQCGVPQGSILGPLLFLVYVNDMVSVIDQPCKLFLYADDSILAVSGNDIDSVEGILTGNMGRLSDWLVENKLSLHLGKTESIMFGSKRRLSKIRSLNVTCRNIAIQSKSVVKYLGAFIDNSLTGVDMCKSVCSKLSKTIYRS